MVNVVGPDKDGKLTVENWSLDNGESKTEETVSGLDFTNTYEVGAAYIKLTAQKKLTGRALKNHEFEFEVVDENNQQWTTAWNDQDGFIEFSPIAFTTDDADKTFTFTVRKLIRRTAIFSPAVSSTR